MASPARASLGWTTTRSVAICCLTTSCAQPGTLAAAAVISASPFPTAVTNPESSTLATDCLDGGPGDGESAHRVARSVFGHCRKLAGLAQGGEGAGSGADLDQGHPRRSSARVSPAALEEEHAEGQGVDGLHDRPRLGVRCREAATNEPN